MNIGTIVTPNTKGQVVIPWKIRQQLNIDSTTPLSLNVAGWGIYLHPISHVVLKDKSADELFADILQRTAGAWGPATAKDRKIEARRRKIELAASRRRKLAW